MTKASKGFLLATAGGVAAAGGAQAADLPVKAEPVLAPAWNWTGFYVGAHVGANYQQAFNTGSYSNMNRTTTDTGFIGGGQIGYNWQMGNAVWGFEADISGLTGEGTHRNHTSLDAFRDKVFSNKVEWLSTVRSRMGLAVGNAMAYATAGVAFGGVKNSQLRPGIPNSAHNISDSSTRVGWVVGGGVETMWTRNWTVGLEGLFVDLGRKDAISPLNSNKFTTFRNQIVIGRLKFNYKF